MNSRWSRLGQAARGSRAGQRVLGATGHGRAARLLAGPPGRSPRCVGMPSSTCLPSTSGSPSGIGYSPVKQAVHSRLAGCSVAAISPCSRDVAQRVGVDRGADAVDVQAVGDQLGPAGEVDAVEARPLHRRRGDPHVHLDGAGLAQHPDQRALGVAAHDRVVDDDQPLAADDVAQRVELEPDAQLPDGLARLDEGAADVGVLDQAQAVGDAARPRRSRRRPGCPTRAPG